MSPMTINRARVSPLYAKQQEKGMVPDKNPREDVDIVPKDGSIWDMVFNEWLTKKSPTRALILDRQKQMNDERAAKGGFQLPGLSLPSVGSGNFEINLDGLQDLSLDPTLKKTTKSAPAPAKKTFRGKAKAAAPVEEKKGGFNLPNFLKPYDGNKISYSDALNKNARK